MVISVCMIFSWVRSFRRAVLCSCSVFCIRESSVTFAGASMFVFDLAFRIFSSSFWISCCTWWGLSAECDMAAAEQGEAPVIWGTALLGVIGVTSRSRSIVLPLSRMAGAEGASSVGSVPPPRWPVLQGVLELERCAWSAVTEDVGLSRTMVLSHPLLMTGPERWVLWPRTPWLKRQAKEGSNLTHSPLGPESRKVSRPSHPLPCTSR